MYAFSFSLYFRCACVLLCSSFPLIFTCLSLALPPSCLVFRLSFSVSTADFCSLLSPKRTHAHTEDLGQFCLFTSPSFFFVLQLLSPSRDSPLVVVVTSCCPLVGSFFFFLSLSQVVMTFCDTPHPTPPPPPAQSCVLLANDSGLVCAPMSKSLVSSK